MIYNFIFKSNIRIMIKRTNNLEKNNLSGNGGNYKILSAKIMRDGEILNSIRIRMNIEDLDIQFDIMEGKSLLDSNDSYFQIEAHCPPTILLDIRITDTLQIRLPRRRPTLASRDPERGSAGGAKLRRRRGAEGYESYAVAYVAMLPTRSKTSSLLHRAVVTVALERTWE